jgi:hypothetical protein
MGYTVQAATDFIEASGLSAQDGQDENRPFIGDVFEHRTRFSYFSQAIAVNRCHVGISNDIWYKQSA